MIFNEGTQQTYDTKNIVGEKLRSESMILWYILLNYDKDKEVQAEVVEEIHTTKTTKRDYSF